MSFVAIEITCTLIVLLYVLVRRRQSSDRIRFGIRFGSLAAAGLVVEATCMGLYGFYGYVDQWTVTLGPMPLLVALIWPCVIFSAWDLGRALVGNRPAKIPWVTGAIVLADASLIEPVAVRAGLWAWSEPGLFEVPPVGILGWAVFGAASVTWFELNRDGPKWRDVLVVIVAWVITHAALLAAWWGALRWCNDTVPGWNAVAVIWLVSLVLTGWALATKAREKVPRKVMLIRIPPAIFFMILLGLYGRDHGPLVAWTLAFSPPYLALTRIF